MTADEGRFAVCLKVSRCASPDTYEYQLVIGDDLVGKPIWLSGNPTPGRKRHAMMICLGLHESS